MKKLTLLLTSLLLAGAANAGFAEFTTDTSQVEEWQDFQVAHPCGIGRLHVGFHDHDGAQCAKKEWVMHCLLQNRPLDTSRGGKTCLDKCPVGKKVPDQLNFRHANKCVRENCPVNHRWQAQHQKCISFADLDAYCKTLNKTYVSETDTCRDVCSADHTWQAQHNKCVADRELQEFCFNEHKKAFDKKTESCQPCPAGTFLQASGCLSQEELDSYCETKGNQVYEPDLNVCRDKCSENEVFQKLYKACAPIWYLGEYCEGIGKVYNRETDACASSCPSGQSPDIFSVCYDNCPNEHSRKSSTSGTECVPFAELGRRCKVYLSGHVYNPATNLCDPSCPNGQAPDESSICRDIPVCSDGSGFNTDTNRCEKCTEGSRSNNNVCVVDAVSCATLNKEFRNGACYTQPSGVACKEINKLYQNGECVDSCIPGAVVENNECVFNTVHGCAAKNAVLAFTSGEGHCVPCREGEVSRDNNCVRSGDTRRAECIIRPGYAFFNDKCGYLVDVLADCSQHRCIGFIKANSENQCPNTDDVVVHGYCWPSRELQSICESTDEGIITKYKPHCDNLSAKQENLRQAPPPAATESSCASQGKGFNFITNECVTCENGYVAYNGNCMASERACKSVGKVFNNRASRCEEPPSVASCAAANGKLYHAVRKQCYVCVDDIDGDGKTVRLDGRCHTPEEVRGVCANPQEVTRLDIADFCLYFTPSEDTNVSVTVTSPAVTVTTESPSVAVSVAPPTETAETSCNANNQIFFRGKCLTCPANSTRDGNVCNSNHSGPYRHLICEDTEEGFGSDNSVFTFYDNRGIFSEVDHRNEKLVYGNGVTYDCSGTAAPSPTTPNPSCTKENYAAAMGVDVSRAWLCDTDGANPCNQIFVSQDGTATDCRGAITPPTETAESCAEKNAVLHEGVCQATGALCKQVGKVLVNNLGIHECQDECPEGTELNEIGNFCFTPR